ncbi:hypothetical protein D7X74_37800 [Corallococcus sp. CA047B]|uniref:hypothetical protein n=1 Tax=Corallococcus sp. CA047B TaxID=2316729 RepID=UPI000EA1832C|nr:hypothetical protein [Corallococcus sp. CA047B]RKH01477.1 hypothetical protein D7X74_37800 [Corallococcus sp. CA047B]
MGSTALAASAPAVRERPILFSAPMVRALLGGRKTVTRRLVKPQRGWKLGWYDKQGVIVPVNADRHGDPGDDITCPYGQPGERLWVREAFHITSANEAVYRADYPGNATARGMENIPAEQDVRWRPSIHMPRWASRLTLEVVSTSVERLHDITEGDAQAEGAVFRDFGRGNYGRQRPGWAMSVEQLDRGTEHCLDTARFAFGNLWNAINGENSWLSNPWVWRVEFRVLPAEW